MTTCDFEDCDQDAPYCHLGFCPGHCADVPHFHASGSPASAEGADVVALIDSLHVDHRNDGTPLRLGGIVEHNARVYRARAAVEQMARDLEYKDFYLGVTMKQIVTAAGMGDELNAQAAVARLRADRDKWERAEHAVRLEALALKDERDALRADVARLTSELNAGLP